MERLLSFSYLQALEEQLWRGLMEQRAGFRRKSGAQHLGSAKRFQCGIHEALTLESVISTVSMLMRTLVSGRGVRSICESRAGGA